MIILALIGGLLVLGIALVVLDAAIAGAKDGYEDSLGFHQEAQQWNRHAPSATPEITPWDMAEGASCPLDIGPSLRPIANTPFTSQSQ